MNKEKLHKEFGKLVQFYRKEKGLTQEDLAEAIDKSVETISNIERGFASTRLSTAAEIAEVLNIELQQLFTLKKETKEEITDQIITELNKMSQEDKQKILNIIRAFQE